MNKAFEKILERLEDELTSTKTKCGTNVDFDKGICKSQEIVQEVAEEYKCGWIPCSERLPEVIEQDMQDLYPHVLVYAEEEDEWNIYVGIYGMYKPKEWVDAHDPTKIIENAIAWQPLPEPFKERDSD